MPRHRQARIPRHRAHQRVEDTARRVRLSAAISAARAALATAHAGQPQESASPTLPLPAVRPGRLRLRPRLLAARVRSAGRVRRAGRVRPASIRAQDDRPGDMRDVARGAARSLLVTPWVAAGAGFVLAAGLWIYSPHTELRFPSTATAPDEIQCATPQCSTGRQSAGQLATSAPSERIRHSQPRHDRAGQPDVAGRPAAKSGLTFTFTVVWHRSGRFDALISVHGKNVPGSWQLAFTMPGAQIGYVIGAQWQALPSGDGGTASRTGSEGQGGARGQGDGYQGVDGFSFMVMGGGRASTPVGCTFNGKACTFK